MYYRNAFAVLLVFDLSNKQSLLTLNYWFDDIKKSFASYNDYKPLLFVVGNKSDLTEREVDPLDILEIVRVNGAVYEQVSAFSGENI